MDDETKKRVISGTPLPPKTEHEEWIYSTCSGCMQADCSIKVLLKDGVVTRIEGNPESPLNKGKSCLRSVAGIMGLYNPYRIKAPMKRTNPQKGPDIDPGWVEISWDEALDTVAARFKKIMAEDPRKLVVWWGWGACEVALVMSRVPSATGHSSHLISTLLRTPNMIYSRPLCAIHYASNTVQMVFQKVLQFALFHFHGEER